MPLIRFPSLDGPQFDFFALIPANLTPASAKRSADEIIMLTNMEFHDDGGDSSIQSIILERLNAYGFSTFFGAQIDAIKKGGKALNDGYQLVPCARIVLMSRIAVSTIEWDAPYRAAGHWNSLSVAGCTH